MIFSGYSPLITAGDLRERLGGEEPPLVLDVRSNAEHTTSHLRGALHIPVDDLRARWEVLPRDREILVYCRSGARAHLAVRILKQHGFDRVANVTGGILAMQAEEGLTFQEAGRATTQE